MPQNHLNTGLSSSSNFDAISFNFLKKVVQLYNCLYLCIMKRKILTYGSYFERFIETLSPKELKKLNYIIALLETSDRMPIKFIKYIRDELFELRMEYESNIYRVFFIFDNDCIIVLFNGFHKKTKKTPENEINKALKIKEAYYEDKRPQNT